MAEGGSESHLDKEGNASVVPQISIIDTSQPPKGASRTNRKHKTPSLSLRAAQSNGLIAYDEVIASPPASRNQSGILSPISESDSGNVQTTTISTSTTGLAISSFQGKLDPLSRQIIARTIAENSNPHGSPTGISSPHFNVKYDGDASDSATDTNKQKSRNESSDKHHHNGSVGNDAHLGSARKDSSADAALNETDILTEEEALAATTNFGKKKSFFSGKFFGVRSKEDKYDKPTPAEELNVEGNDAPLYEQIPGIIGQQPPRYIRVRSRRKNAREFNKLFLAQQLTWQKEDHDNDSAGTPGLKSRNSHIPAYKTHAIWSLRFSMDGKFLAAAGQDTVIRVWEVLCKDNTNEDESRASSPANQGTPAQGPGTPAASSYASDADRAKLRAPVFKEKPTRVWMGHTSDVLDLCWSKSNFLLSSSMDKTVKLWHPSRAECLCSFQHLDFVTAIVFHPRDDRFFLSGSLDCRLRLWNIPEKKVAYWTELPGLITAVSFTLDGKMSVAGTLTGLCLFYETEGLKYNTQIHVRSTRGKNAKGKKITGIEPMPGTAPGDDKLLITSNDSRIRCYNMRDKALDTKYKGLDNYQSQIRATFSDDGRYILSGSEDRHVYIWNNIDAGAIRYLPISASLSRNESLSRRESIESSSSKSVQGSQSALSAHHRRRLLGYQKPLSKGLNAVSGTTGGWGLHMKRSKPGFESFEAHDSLCTVATFAPTQSKQLLAQTMDPIFRNTPRVSAYGLQPIMSIASAESTGSVEVLKESTNRNHGGTPSESLDREPSVSSPAGSVIFGKHTYPDGNIIVSADNVGNIKVFRNDCAVWAAQ